MPGEIAGVAGALSKVIEAGLLGALFVLVLGLWWFERRLVTTCSEKLVDAWKSLGELISNHNQTTREQIASQDARSRALEAQTRAYEMSLQIEAQRTEAARSVAQLVKDQAEKATALALEIKDLKTKIEALEGRIRDLLLERRSQS